MGVPLCPGAISFLHPARRLHEQNLVSHAGLPRSFSLKKILYAYLWQARRERRLDVQNLDSDTLQLFFLQEAPRAQG